jgi:uncharacterized Zn finger protein
MGLERESERRMLDPNFPRRDKKPLPMHPRRVRGGVRLAAGELVEAGLLAPESGLMRETSPTAWAAHRLLRLLEAAAQGDALVEGLEYAKTGQTRRMSLEPGRVIAAVQGRAERAYAVTITMATFPEPQWTKVGEAMASQAAPAAKLLAGELPPSIEDIFGPLGLKLVPTEAGDLSPSCTCGHITTAATAWCKHVCCVMYLLADELRQEPFRIFKLRGQPVEDVIEGLRQRRAVTSAASGSAPACAPRIPGVTDVQAPPLDQEVGRFWDAGPELAEVDVQLDPPAVSKPLLRRLGPSPFDQAAFPLVGLLATCYDVISERAAAGRGEPVQEEEGAAGESEVGSGG